MARRRSHPVGDHASRQEDAELEQLEGLGHRLGFRSHENVHILVCEKCGRTAMVLSLHERCANESEE